jgi:protoheme ferro-lyase
VRLVRPPALNEDPLFIGALAEAIREKAAELLPVQPGNFSA